MAFENIVVKGEDTVNQSFFHFPKCFHPSKNERNFFTWLICCQHMVLIFGIVYNSVIWYMVNSHSDEQRLLCYNHIFVFTGIYTKKAMKNFKSLEAHRQFTAGWVQTVFHLKPSHSKTLVLKATVRPSWKVNDEPHSPWVAVDPDGTVLTAHCNCKAG